MWVKHIFAISIAASKNQLMKCETKFAIPYSVYDGVNARACVLHPFDQFYGDIILTAMPAVIRHHVKDEERPPAENERTNHNRQSSRQFDLDQHGPNPLCAVSNHAVNVSVRE